MLTLLGHQFSPLVSGIILFVVALFTTILAFVVKSYVSKKISSFLGTVLAIIIGLFSLIVWLLFIFTAGANFISWFIKTKAGHICMLIVFVACGGFGFFAKAMKSSSKTPVFYDKAGHMHYDNLSRNEANARIDKAKRENENGN